MVYRVIRTIVYGPFLFVTIQITAPDLAKILSKTSLSQRYAMYNASKRDFPNIFINLYLYTNNFIKNSIFYTLLIVKIAITFVRYQNIIDFAQL